MYNIWINYNIIDIYDTISKIININYIWNY